MHPTEYSVICRVAQGKGPLHWFGVGLRSGFTFVSPVSELVRQSTALERRGRLEILR